MDNEIKNIPPDSGWNGAKWIPLLIGMLLSIIGLNYLVIPILSLFINIKPFIIPDKLWEFILFSIPPHLGYKSIEKHVQPFIDALSNKLNK